MQFTNARIFTPEGWMTGSFSVEEGRFSNILSGAACGGIDLGGAKVIPGLVDIHTHGAAGADFSDGDFNGLVRMAEYLACCGVTSFMPTSMTLPYGALSAAFKTAHKLQENRVTDCARVLGIHMEGPFLSEKRKGAQNSDYLRMPDIGDFKDLNEQCGGLIRIVDLAPELPGAIEFTRQVCKVCKVSAAHTDADYEEASVLFDAGATHLTHLFNAMPPVHHRSPGVIGAASERDNVKAELICDGLHVHPSAVRMAFRLFPGRICLVSDSLRCCGMPDGEYELGGQPVILKDGAARLADGTIAGASSNLYEDMLNAIRCGIPEEDAIRSATIIPAAEAAADKEVGSIEAGKLADFAVCTEDLALRQVYIGGERVSESHMTSYAAEILDEYPAAFLYNVSV